jgi:hypothetical protein
MPRESSIALLQCEFPSSTSQAHDAGVHAKPIQRKHAAGIDIGATSIYVAVPVDRDPQPVRSFKTFTEDLHRLN